LIGLDGLKHLAPELLNAGLKSVLEN